MRIEKYVEKLSEADAKSALLWYMGKLPIWLSCKDCNAESRCKVAWKNEGYETCVKNLLKLSLRESKKNNTDGDDSLWK